MLKKFQLVWVAISVMTGHDKVKFLIVTPTVSVNEGLSGYNPYHTPVPKSLMLPQKECIDENDLSRNWCRRIIC